MRLKWLLGALAFSIFLFAFELWAVADHLYWRYVWSDTVTHFIGGAFAGTLAVALLLRFKPLFFIIIVGTIVIGWELFEYGIGTPHAKNFIFDTAVDLLMDTLGALVAYTIARQTLWHSV